MTHEYTILSGGVVERPRVGVTATATGIAYAGGVVLAIGTDDDTHAISRGDSIVVDLRGRHVIPLVQAATQTWPAACDRDGIDRLATLAAADGCAEELDIGTSADFAICSMDGCLEAIVVDGVLAWGQLGP